jgi:hypothetical protein
MPRKASRQRLDSRRRRKRVSRASRAQPSQINVKTMLKSPKIALKPSSIKVVSSSLSTHNDFVKSILKRNKPKRQASKSSTARRKRKQSRVRFSRRNSIRRFYK